MKINGNDTVWTTGMRAARQSSPVKINNNVNESGLVTSSQTGVHPHLEKYVRRHLENPWSQPYHQPTVEAYHQLGNKGVFSAGQPIILDSGCGTGKSTQRLAALFPGHIVIGVDRSQVRLAKSGANSSFFRNENYILLRADLPTFWRMLVNDGHTVEKHFLFYPNPWPKPGHLLRRWHAHPVFPQLLALGGEIEMRCNWEIYALEFAQAIFYASGTVVKVNNYQPDSGVSPFEQKYLDRGQSLFSVTVSVAGGV